MLTSGPRHPPLGSSGRQCCGFHPQTAVSLNLHCAAHPPANLPFRPKIPPVCTPNLQPAFLGAVPRPLAHHHHMPRTIPYAQPYQSFVYIEAHPTGARPTANLLPHATATRRATLTPSTVAMWRCVPSTRRSTATLPPLWAAGRAARAPCSSCCPSTCRPC